MTSDPLETVADELPVVGPPSPAQTARARNALLAHIAAGEGVSPRWQNDHRQGSPVGGRRIWSKSLRLGAAAAMLAVVAVGAVVASRGEPSAVVVIVGPSETSSVEAFVARVTDRGAPSGDATIIERTHGSDGATRVGVDVFTDDGRYAYGASVDDAVAVFDRPGPARPWPVPGYLEEALVAVVDGGGGSARDDAPGRFVEALFLAEGGREESGPVDVEGEAWSRLLAALPVLPGSPEAAVGALYVLDGMTDVELLDATIDGADVVVAVRNTTRGSERVFFDADRGTAVRYEGRTTAGQIIAQVTYVTERIDLGR